MKKAKVIVKVVGTHALLNAAAVAAGTVAWDLWKLASYKKEL